MSTYECNFHTLMVVGAGIVFGVALRLIVAALFNL